MEPARSDEEPSAWGELEAGGADAERTRAKVKRTRQGDWTVSVIVFGGVGVLMLAAVFALLVYGDWLLAGLAIVPIIVIILRAMRRKS